MSNAQSRSPSTSPYIRCPPAYSFALWVRTTASVVTSILAPSAVPYQTSAKPVLWVSSHSIVPSALDRMNPVSIARSYTFSPRSSTSQERLM